MSDTVSPQQIAELVEDATLLREEAQSLQALIETVPYEQSTPNESSIQDKLHLLDELQVTYFHPVFELVYREGPAENSMESLSEVVERLSSEENRQAPDIQSILESLSERRASLLDRIREIPAGEWERTIIRNGEELSIYQFAVEMVQFDQKVLKDVAGLVMVFQQDSWSRREINQQAAARNSQRNNNSRQDDLE